MRKKLDTGIKPSDITPEGSYLNRRTVLTAAVAAGLVPSIMSCEAATLPASGDAFADVKKWPDSTKDKVNTTTRKPVTTDAPRVPRMKEKP